MRRHSKKTVTWKRALSQLHWHPYLRLLASKLWEINWSFISSPVCDILLQWPEQTKTGRVEWSQLAQDLITENNFFSVFCPLFSFSSLSNLSSFTISKSSFALILICKSPAHELQHHPLSYNVPYFYLSFCLPIWIAHWYLKPYI